MKRILVTGGAGFLGYHITKKLKEEGHYVVIMDNMNDYYDVTLKTQRVKALSQIGVPFIKADITHSSALDSAFALNQFDTVIHLAAQPGVRYSLVNPQAYIHSNILGMTEILEVSKRHEVDHVMYASSSSVYSGNTTYPSSETDVMQTPLSLYAITKQTNEMQAELFSDQTNIPTTGLRFFTAYGPMGRPDMAYWAFTEKILAGHPIPVYRGSLSRDFTYCGDVAEAVVRLLVIPRAIHRVINIGNNRPAPVIRLVNILEDLLGRDAHIDVLERPCSEPIRTCCNNDLLFELTGFRPETDFRYGLEQFVTWYTQYHKVT